MDEGTVGGSETGKDRWARGNNILLIDRLMGHDLIIHVILIYFFY